jgi:Fur family ferric uptake transcriptional regulator
MTRRTGSNARGAAQPAGFQEVRRRLRDGGLRWTPQRGTLLEVLNRMDGHVTGAELVEACRAIDPSTTPSTVYRSLDVLEELGIVSHSHGLEGRQEFHVRPVGEHGHLACSRCGRSWELTADEVRPLVDGLERGRGFGMALDHLTVVGLCETCRGLQP